MKRTKLLQAAATLAAALCSTAALAAFPERPIHLVVPFPAGGSTDLIARTIAPRLGAELHQSVIVDNKAGAASLIGSEYVARAAPDGYTILMAGLTNVFLPFVQKNLTFHPVDDFTGIGLVADTPNVLAVNAATPYRSLADLVKADHAKPGSISFGSAGVGTPSHLVCEMVNHQAHLKLLHVPYKGNAPAVTDLMGGQIPVMCNNLAGTLPYMNSGKIRILAQTGKARSESVPNVPTFREAGVAGLDSGLWVGLVAPKATPAPVVKTLNEALAKVLAQPEVRKKLAKLGATALDPSPAAYEARIRADRQTWEPLLKTLDLKAQ